MASRISASCGGTMTAGPAAAAEDRKVPSGKVASSRLGAGVEPVEPKPPANTRERPPPVAKPRSAATDGCHVVRSRRVDGVVQRSRQATDRVNDETRSNSGYYQGALGGPSCEKLLRSRLGRIVFSELLIAVRRFLLHLRAVTMHLEAWRAGTDRRRGHEPDERSRQLRTARRHRAPVLRRAPPS